MTNIRLIGCGEETAVSAMATEVFDQFVAHDCTQDGVKEFHRYADPAALLSRNLSDHVTFVAERYGRLVGMLHLRPSHVAMLFVRGDAQRSGVGQELLRAALHQCATRWPDTESLTVSASPSSVEAYRKFGFVPTGVEQIKNGIRFVPMELMLKGPDQHRL